MRRNELNSTVGNYGNGKYLQKMRLVITGFFLAVFFIISGSIPASAHCDSYDGPTIKDALTALETNNVNLVLKWVDKQHEEEIITLFKKTQKLRNGDAEIYSIVEKHFLETLVRLHREAEGAPFTGLKPAGTTQKIVLLSDQALSEGDIDGLLVKINNHINQVVKEKFNKVAVLESERDESTEKGREYVAAYVDYTHTVEALHSLIEKGSDDHGTGHNH